ncbi:MAG TPA: glycosyltransferase [Hyphomonadaceae bacterium]|nr:glycosyltransferase [Hyphomonadaceae bacterium]
MKVVSCRPAWVRTSNRFTNLFSEAVQGSDWTVREFSWAPKGVLAPKVILLHWPDELFTCRNPFELAKAAFKLGMLNLSRSLFGSRLVWVVHEAKPHDKERRPQWSTRTFLGSLDGAIYLSNASRRVAEADVPELKRVPALVTRHGHYRFDMEKPAEPRRAPGKRIDLVYFGQVRPYRNADGLIRAAEGLSPDEVRITILGWCKDPDYKKQLEDLAAKAPAIRLDVRDEFVPQADLEAALDDSDGCVLPYRVILNSGAALFALSRNRPVMAPRLGTLPELQNEVGEDWVDLYDGDITTEDLKAFCASVRATHAPVADLSLYEWKPIGEQIRRFFDQISQARRAVPAAGLSTPDLSTQGLSSAQGSVPPGGFDEQPDFEGSEEADVDEAGGRPKAAQPARAGASEAPAFTP